MKICFVGWGDHVHLERWAGWFATHGFSVTVVSTGDVGHYPSNVRQFRMGLKGRGPRWLRLKLRYLLRRIRPDIVHVHWAHFAVFVRQAWSGPLVVTAWGSDVYRKSTFTASQWADLRNAMRASELITCDSRDLSETIQLAFDVPSERIAVIQWGVDTNLFRPEGEDKRKELGLENRPVIFSARNFLPVYNQETVIAAFADVRRRFPDAFLLMKRYGGDASYLEMIRADIANRGLKDHVRILESVRYEEMPPLYRTADVMVTVPLSDAAPMSLLEAMAAGVVSVVSDLPSLREWVRNGETGYLVDPTDPSAVAAALCKVLEVKVHNGPMVERARQLVIDCASQRAHMEVMGQHYGRLISQVHTG